MTPATEPGADAVRELLAPLARVQPVTLRRDPSSHRARRLGPVAVAATVLALAGVGAGVAAATGVLPWWHAEQAAMSAMSSPFATSPDPAAVAGSDVRLTLPGPDSTTFEVVTNTVTVGTDRERCTAIAVRDSRGRSQHLTTGCGGASAAVPSAESFEWRAPSGVAYRVTAGPVPVATATKVALQAANGAAAATEPVSGGYYLVYGPAAVATASLVFYDERGQVVDEVASPHP